MDKGQVCAVLVSYNPSPEILANAQILLEQVAHLIVVDNTLSPGAVAADVLRRLERLEACTVIRNGANLGVAAALNLGFKAALSEEFSWIITFDQDSQVSEGYIEAICSAYAASSEPSQIGILCPAYRHATLDAAHPPLKRSNGELLVWMTSGSMMKSETYLKLGPFEEQLFIDGVDTEYALRMHAAGYKMVEVPQAILKHSLGNTMPHVFFGRRIFVTNHSPKRRYFITRNRLILLWRYFNKDKEWAKYELTDLIKGTVALFLYEQDRFLKAGYMVRAVRDATLGRMGPSGVMPDAP